MVRKKIFGLRDPFPEKNNISAVVSENSYEEFEITSQEK
jgi:hypothetical protein